MLTASHSSLKAASSLFFFLVTSLPAMHTHLDATGASSKKERKARLYCEHNSRKCGKHFIAEFIILSLLATCHVGIFHRAACTPNQTRTAGTNDEDKDWKLNAVKEH